MVWETLSSEIIALKTQDVNVGWKVTATHQLQLDVMGFTN